MEAEDQHRRAIAQHLAAESHSMVCKSIFISKLNNYVLDSVHC